MTQVDTRISIARRMRRKIERCARRLVSLNRKLPRSIQNSGFAPCMSSAPVICCQIASRPHGEGERCAQTISIAFEDSLMREPQATMPETTTLLKRNLGPRPAAVTRVETKLPRCVQRRLPCAPVPIRCHPRSSPYRCIDHRAPKRPYRLAVGLSMTRTGRGTPTSIPNSCSDRCPPGFRGTPHCKKSLSMMDLSLAVADPDGDLK